MSGPPTGIVLREALGADLPDLADLWVATWQRTVPTIDFTQRRPWFLDRMTAHDAAGCHTVVAVAGNVIVGFVVIDPATGYLDQIVAAATHQGRGVATALLEAAKTHAPHGIDLHVNQDNHRAIGFYKKHGFAITGHDVNERSGAPVYQMSWPAF